MNCGLGVGEYGTYMLTKEFMKQDVSHFLPVLHPSHLGSGKEEKQDTSGMWKYGITDTVPTRTVTMGTMTQRRLWLN